MTLHVAVVGSGWRRGASIRRALPRLVAVAVAAGLASAAGAQAGPRTAHLVGKVIDGAGIPVARAEVSVLPNMALRATTSDSGTFRIDSLPVGALQLSVRRMGFESATFSAELKEGRTSRVTLPLTQLAAALPEVDIKDTADAHHWLDIFNRHRAQAATGTFFTRADIVKSQVRVMTDLLRRVPGIRINPLAYGTQVLFERGAGSTNGRGPRPCAPQMFVHSMNYTGSMDDFNPDDVEALEIYIGISQVPAELQTTKAQTCGAIVVWTREPPPAQKKVPGSGG